MSGFLSEHEYAVVAAAADVLIPPVDTHPGGAALGADFCEIDPLEQDQRLRAQPELRRVLYIHACEGAYGPPEYGGNRDRNGWRAIEFPGDSQPRGYTDDEVSGRA